MTFLTLTLFTILLCAFSILFYRRVWNPIFLFLIMFFLGLILAKGDCSENVFEDAVFWILIGELFFIISFLIAQTIFRRRPYSKYSISVEYNLLFVKKLINVNIIISILVFFIGLYSVMQVAPRFIDIFINSTYVRNLYLNRSGNRIVSLISFFLSLNFYVTFVFFPIALQNKVRRTVPKLCLVLSIRLASSLVTMSKELFLIDIIYFVSIYIMILRDKNEEYNFYKKYGSFLGTMITLLILVISFQRDYIGQGRYSGYGEALLGTLRTYISVPMESFGELINVNDLVFTNGDLCFRPIVNIFSYLGIGSHVSIIQDAVIRGTTANVYTSFGNMYRDFSYLGIIVLSIFFGLMLGVLYKPNHKNRISRIIINGIIVMTMFYAYYDLKIIQTIYLIIMIYAVIFEKICAEKIYIKKTEISGIS